MSLSWGCVKETFPIHISARTNLNPSSRNSSTMNGRRCMSLQQGQGRSSSCHIHQRSGGKDTHSRNSRQGSFPTSKNMETSIHNSQDAVQLVYPVLSELDHEEAWVIFLTTCNKVIAKEMLSKGTLTHTSIDSRTILRQALLHNAAAIILCHNHPSGNECPSRADIGLTDKLRKACSLLDIPLLDHIIVGDGAYFSFSDEQTVKI